MSNSLLSYINVTPNLTISQPYLPATAVNLDALKTQQLSDVAILTKVVDASEPWSGLDGAVRFVIDASAAGSDYGIGVIGLLNLSCNVDRAMTVQVIVASDPMLSFVYYDSTQLDFRPSSQWLRANNHLHVLPIPVPGTTFVTRVIISVDSTAIADGVEVSVTIGGLWIGPSFTTEHGLEAGWSVRSVDLGGMAYSTGGQGYPDIKVRPTEVRASWAPVPFAIAFGDPYTPDAPDMQSVMSFCGTSAPCIFVVRSQDAAGNPSQSVTERLAVYGHFTDIGSINDVGGDNFTWGPLTFRELL